jgi:hypothetical protein
MTLIDSSHRNEWQMLLGSFKSRFSHGLLVVSAPESIDSHDDWDAATEGVHAGQDSLYIGVRDTASGLVSVTCVEVPDVETELSVLFSGKLTLPSARLQFYDPDETISMTVPVSAESVTITVFADHDDEPSELLVQVTSASQ